MSTVDPERRWWRHPGSWRVLVVALWVVLVAVTTTLFLSDRAPVVLAVAVFGFRVVVGLTLFLARAWSTLVKRRQQWSRGNGVEAVATVTKVSFTTVLDVDYWVLTLKYTDQQGRGRWHRARLALGPRVSPKIGDRYALRYDPAHPGRHSAIYLNPVKRGR